MSTGGIVSSRDFPIQSEKALGPIPVQEPRSGARAKGAGCRVQGAGCRKQGSLCIKPEERRPVLWSELKADAAIDH